MELQEVCLNVQPLSVIYVQIFKISDQPNQDLVRNTEEFGLLLAHTLNEETPETIKSRSNVGMYALLCLYI